MRGETTIGDDERAQSDVLGVALITALVVIGTVGIVALGTDVLAGARGDAQIESAEQAMTKMDATAALIALGKTDSQRAEVSLRGVDESLDVREDDGWMNVSIVNRSSGDHLDTVMNRTLGSVVYESDGTSISYQGGGVWKKVDNASIMVSPPEFHYRGNTLTLPLISVRGGDESVAGGKLVLEREGNRNQTYPDPSRSMLNPLPETKQVNVTVHSEYYDAWGRFFAQRTEGSVTYDHPNETVIVELIVPFQTPFEEPLVATSPDGVEPHPPGGEDWRDKYIEDADYPSADSIIEDEIDECVSDGCKEPDDATSLTGGTTYFFDEDVTSSTIVANTSDGDITLVVDGEFKPDNIDIDGNGNLTVYVKGYIELKGEYNWESDNEATQLLIYGHSSGTDKNNKLDIEFKGEVYFKGLIYAPELHANFRGSGEFVGSLVAYEIEVRGTPSNVVNDPGLGNIDLGLRDDESAYINYLYVSGINLSVKGTA